MDARHTETIQSAAVPMLWVALIAALSVGGSYVYACATPFAAIGALAASKMDRRTGLTLVLLAWVANQLVGYGLLDYPQTANSFAWGGAIGLAAVAGFFAARAVAHVELKRVLSLAASLAIAFIVYEGVLYAASFGLGASEAAFSLEIVWQIFVINAVAFGAVLALYWGVGIVRAGAEAHMTSTDHLHRRAG